MRGVLGWITPGRPVTGRPTYQFERNLAMREWWICVRCGDAFFSSIPEELLCTACLTATKSRAARSAAGLGTAREAITDG